MVVTFCILFASAWCLWLNSHLNKTFILSLINLLFCLFSLVRIYNGIGRSQSSGPVLIFRDKDWYLLCDDGFTDHAATLVCQELGFPYGYASCCSADGPLSVPIWMNHTLDCSSGNHVEECLHEKICARRSYATVSCSYQPKTTVGKNIGGVFFWGGDNLIDDKYKIICCLKIHYRFVPSA